MSTPIPKATVAQITCRRGLEATDVRVHVCACSACICIDHPSHIADCSGTFLGAREACVLHQRFLEAPLHPSFAMRFVRPRRGRPASAPW
eukprot:SAG11_NODE_35165_length_268_cov_0.603550_1_plen_89_part_11